MLSCFGVTSGHWNCRKGVDRAANREGEKVLETANIMGIMNGSLIIESFTFDLTSSAPSYGVQNGT